ncbi:hypothetical protein [Rhodopseudomonas palustris]|nr:hypothetical protein [Rhodopseudomonas palustris]OPF95616.1 hypothetical protein B1S06_05475 [Rhodopseudomonas palustris]WAB77636.1 hypothetical protein OR798_24660 [Rhodopseudomonas palustris]WCL94951.1 hypothetical protein TX73_024655 [Rhodopseudomonas palustris CGA009]WND51546.1 hypothetical protein L1A21_24575 [Rhodopseudomonas palustris]
MDMSMISAALAMQASSTQMQISTTIQASAARTERETVQTLLGIGQGGSPSLANVGPGVGGSLNISA